MIGVIGGSGMYKMPLEDVKRVAIKTPFGDPSGEYVVGTIGGVQVAFLARHGEGHTILPQDLNARANIYGFKKLGVKWLISNHYSLNKKLLLFATQHSQTTGFVRFPRQISISRR